MHDSSFPLNRIISLFFAIICFLLPIFSLFGDAFIIISAILLGGIFLWHHRITFIQNIKAFPVKKNALFMAFSLFFTLCLLSLTWSENHSFGLYTLIKIVPFILMGIFFSVLKSPNNLYQSTFPTRLHLIGFSFGYVIGCVILLFSPFLTEKGYIHLATKTTIHTGLFLSLSFWVVVQTALSLDFLPHWRKILLLLGLTALSIFTLTKSQCDTALISLILGALTSFLIFLKHTPIMMRTLQTLIILSFVTTPLICFYGFSHTTIASFQTILHDPSYLHRLFLWHKTAEKIKESPLKGYGIGGSRSFSTTTTFDLHYTDSSGLEQNVQAEQMGVHPHNIALQLWLELGVIGSLLGGWIVSLIFQKSIQSHSKRLLFSTFGCFVTAMITFWVNVDAFRTWWLSSIICVMTLFFSFNYPPSHSIKK